jgi:hypothetical protein
MQGYQSSRALASEAAASILLSLGPLGPLGPPRFARAAQHIPRLDPSLPSPSRKPATNKEAHIRCESW